MAECKDCIYESICEVWHRQESQNACCFGDWYKNKADFVEVKRGYWIDDIQKFASPAGVTKDYLVGYKCSVCGRQERIKEPYCNCGAKMYGRENDSNV